MGRGRGAVGRRWGGGNRKGETGKGAKGRGRRRGKRRVEFTDGYDEMPGWNEVTVFVWLCLPVHRRVPQLVLFI